MVNILARNAYLCPSPEICGVISAPFFAVLRDIARSKIYQISLTEFKNCQIVEIRLLNMKINK